MKVRIPDGGSILIGGIFDNAGGIFGFVFQIFAFLIGLLLPAVQGVRE